MKTIISSYEIFLEALPIIESAYVDLNSEMKIFFIGKISQDYVLIQNRLKQLELNISFYEQFRYFNNNVVALGATGSGETSLADNLRSSLNNNRLVISAQKSAFSSQN